MGQVLTKNEGFSDFCEGWVPFLLEIKQKAGWLVGMILCAWYTGTKSEVASVRCHLSAILLSPKNNSPHGRTSTTVLPLIDRDKCPLQLGEGPVRIAHIVRDRELSRIFLANIDYRPRVPSIGRP